MDLSALYDSRKVYNEEDLARQTPKGNLNRLRSIGHKAGTIIRHQPHSNTYLCPKCRLIFHRLHEISIEDSGKAYWLERHLKLTFLDSRWGEALQRCACCQMLTRALRIDRDVSMDWLGLSLFSRIINPRSLGFFLFPRNLLGENGTQAPPTHSTMNSTMAIVVTRTSITSKRSGDRKKTEVYMPLRDVGKRGFVMPARTVNRENAARPSSQNISGYEARHIERGYIDFATVRSWINDCIRHRGQCLSDALIQNEVANNLIVIDCSTSELVRKPLASNYVALSYVWGNKAPSLNDLKSRSSRIGKDVVPRVIRDAISVTTQLGYRYLWVDRYCIDQADPHNKTRTIEMMDHIYEGATLTIIAAAGTDDKFGLPGTGTYPLVLRDPQPAATRWSAYYCLRAPRLDLHAQNVQVGDQRLDISGSHPVSTLPYFYFCPGFPIVQIYHTLRNSTIIRLNKRPESS